MLGRLIASLFGPRFWIVGYASLAVGLFCPGDFSGLRPLIPFVLGLMLFFTSLRVRFGAITTELRQRNAVPRLGALVGVKLLALPLAVYALALVVAPPWALGLFLVSAMPAGMSSAALTGLYGGDIGLGLLLIIATNIVCPLSVPLQLQLLGGRPHWSEAARQAAYILAVLAVPVALAQLCWRAAPAAVAARAILWQRLALAVMTLLVFVSAAPCRAAWQDFPPSALLLPVALTCGASLLFAAVSLIARRGLPPPQTIAFGCACIYMNNALAIAVATRFYPSDAHILLPSIMMQVPMLGVTALFGECMRERPTA